MDIRGEHMFEFGPKSLKELGTCRYDLKRIAHAVLKLKDHSVIKGHRNQAEQDVAFFASPPRSKLRWPDGKHNQNPSIAMDVKTWPVPETEAALREDQLYLLGLYVGVANGQGLTLRTGADWDRDGEIADNGFDDFFHVEIDDRQT